MKILAIIPARGGSKGIKNKNIINLCGQPLIHYTLKEALKVDEFSRIIVSTESDLIKSVCEQYGDFIPFMRPAKLADDSSRTIDVVIDVLNQLKKQFDEEYDYVCLLQPTSPLRTSKDIQNCIRIIKEQGQASVVSLTKIDEPHPYKMKVLKGGLVFPLLEGTNSSVPRQELPPVYELNGAVYLSDIKTILDKKTFFNKKSLPYIMPQERAVNINNTHDLYHVKMILTEMKSNDKK